MTQEGPTLTDAQSAEPMFRALAVSAWRWYRQKHPGHSAEAAQRFVDWLWQEFDLARGKLEQERWNLKHGASDNRTSEERTGDHDDRSEEVGTGNP